MRTRDPRLPSKAWGVWCPRGHRRRRCRRHPASGRMSIVADLASASSASSVPGLYVVREVLCYRDLRAYECCRGADAGRTQRTQSGRRADAGRPARVDTPPPGGTRTGSDGSSGISVRIVRIVRLRSLVVREIACCRYLRTHSRCLGRTHADAGRTMRSQNPRLQAEGERGCGGETVSPRRGHRRRTPLPSTPGIRSDEFVAEPSSASSASSAPVRSWSGRSRAVDTYERTAVALGGRMRTQGGRCGRRIRAFKPKVGGDVVVKRFHHL